MLLEIHKLFAAPSRRLLLLTGATCRQLQGPLPGNQRTPPAGYRDGAILGGQPVPVEVSRLTRELALIFANCHVVPQTRPRASGLRAARLAQHVTLPIQLPCLLDSACWAQGLLLCQPQSAGRGDSSLFAHTFAGSFCCQCSHHRSLDLRCIYYCVGFTTKKVCRLHKSAWPAGSYMQPKPGVAA